MALSATHHSLLVQGLQLDPAPAPATPNQPNPPPTWQLPCEIVQPEETSIDLCFRLKPLGLRVWSRRTVGCFLFLHLLGGGRWKKIRSTGPLRFGLRLCLLDCLVHSVIPGDRIYQVSGNRALSPDIYAQPSGCQLLFGSRL